MPSLIRRMIAPTLVCGLLAACTDAPSSVEPSEDRSLIRTLGADGFAALLESTRGDVVLINLWATWCAPCLKEIPDLVELEADLSGRGFRLIGISLDNADAGEQVRSFRDEYFPEFFTYHVGDDDWYELINVLAPDWASVLPTVFVIGRNGELTETLMGGKDYQTFAETVEPLL
ncbi:TlpA family protein disulfide reductase [Candidatus Rariloculus sp.]|uniref:TlpA family protein disulfide reductase n=1 Tax=Candidatus Rariloculus sp. TaxID=3101265 RepID=UPI003D134D34